MSRLENQSILVTGGASGLGLAIVERLIEEGASVGVLDRSAEGCADLESRFEDRVIGTVGDVREYEDNERAVAVMSIVSASWTAPSVMLVSGTTIFRSSICLQIN